MSDSKIQLNKKPTGNIKQCCMEEHSLAEEIMNLGRNRHQYSATELKVKFNEFSRKLKQANSENNEAGDCKLIDSLRALSILAEMCGELENAEVYLKRIIQISPRIGESWQVRLLDLNTQLGSILLRTGKTKEAKKNLKVSNELYQNSRAISNETKEKLDNFLKVTDSDMPSSTEFIDLLHTTLLKNYEQYYTIMDDPEKLVYNGILVLKYELKYNSYDSVIWAQHAVDLSPYCCETRAFRQSHYLLRAAEVMLEHFRKGIRGADLASVNDARFLEGRIKLGLAQHALILIYERENIRLIQEKCKQGLILTAEQEKDLKVNEQVTEFDEITVPIGNAKLDVPIKTQSDTCVIYESIKQWMRETGKLLTRQEMSQNGFDKISEKMEHIKSIHCYLN